MGCILFLEFLVKVEVSPNLTVNDDRNAFGRRWDGLRWPILNFDIAWTSVRSFTPRSPYPRERTSGTYRIESVLDPRMTLGAVEKGLIHEHDTSLFYRKVISYFCEA